MFSSLPNTDGFYTFHISQGSVATQLRCGDMFVNHFATNFFTEFTSEKKFENRSIFGKDMSKTLWLTFLGHPVYQDSWQAEQYRVTIKRNKERCPRGR